MKDDFESLLAEKNPYTDKQRGLYKLHGICAFLEICSIIYVRSEEAVIIGGSLENYAHIAEHGDILYKNGEVEFGGSCEFDHLFESTPYV